MRIAIIVLLLYIRGVSIFEGVSSARELQMNWIYSRIIHVPSKKLTLRFSSSSKTPHAG